MRFLSWIVVFLTVYLSTFLLFVTFWKTHFIQGSIDDFLKLKVMKESPQNRRPFTFSMKPGKVKSELPRSAKLNLHVSDIRWSLIVMVKSHSSHRSRRMLARMTWASFEYINGVRIETVFIVGKAQTEEEKTSLEEENGKFGDLLQLNLEEKYTSVGFKTLAGMQYAATHFPAEWMYASADDDISPDWVEMLEKFDEMRKSSINDDRTPFCNLGGHLPIMCGFGCVVNPLPKREDDSKWYINESDYPLPEYPTYCLGGFYGMSVKLASELYDTSRALPFFWIDDVWITGFLRLKRFISSDPKCEINADVGIWSTTEEAYSSTGIEHELLEQWTKYVAKIHEKEYIYVNEEAGQVQGTPVPYEWNAWLEYVFHHQPAVESQFL